MQMRVCSKCKEEKSLEVFVKDKRRKDKHSSLCIECDKVRCRLRRGSKPRADAVESSWTTYTRTYRYSARIRNLEFSLSPDVFKRLTTQPCEYCNKLPVKRDFVGDNRRRYLRQERPNKSGLRRRSFAKPGKIQINGIDRIDSTKGYFLENCVTACTDCNLGKQSLTQAAFALNTLERCAWAKSYSETYPDSIQAILAAREKENENPSE